MFSSLLGFAFVAIFRRNQLLSRSNSLRRIEKVFLARLLSSRFTPTPPTQRNPAVSIIQVVRTSLWHSAKHQIVHPPYKSQTGFRLPRVGMRPAARNTSLTEPGPRKHPPSGGWGDGSRQFVARRNLRPQSPDAVLYTKAATSLVAEASSFPDRQSSFAELTLDNTD